MGPEPQRTKRSLGDISPFSRRRRNFTRLGNDASRNRKGRVMSRNPKSKHPTHKGFSVEKYGEDQSFWTEVGAVCAATIRSAV
jgi:hypothetical protein